MARYLSAALGLWIWCWAAQAQQPPDRPDTPAPAPYNGSLLRTSLNTPPEPYRARLSQVSLYAVPEPEPRIIRKHDLVTIIVREVSEFSSEGTTDLKKQAALNARVEDFIKLYLDNWQIKGGNVGSPIPRIAGGSDRSFKGEATVDRTDSFVARITAQVVDVKPNGTLVLAARKRIKTDEEVQEMLLSGTCRSEDVTADNTVLSTQLTDVNLEKRHTGAVRDTTKRGLVARLLDFLNPF